jgi:hypothetical protein
VALTGSTTLTLGMLVAWGLSNEPADPRVFNLMLGTLGLDFIAYAPRLCTVSDQGVEFHVVYPWDHILRFHLNDRRLLLVAKRPTDRSLTQHVEIPLNGLPAHLHRLSKRRSSNIWPGQLFQRLADIYPPRYACCTR